MFEMFGAEMPLAVRFFLAFLVVLGLIGATAWAVRRFGAGRLGASARGRQPRLAVVDYASVDGRRKLILVRRDNVEHLLMIGGPSDVVVEPNIVRATAAPRDVPGTRPAAGLEALPRAIPLPENGTNGSWPLQPAEPTSGSRPLPRIEPLPDELPRSLQPHVEPPARPQRDTLDKLAEELSVRPTPPRNRPLARPQIEEPEPETPEELDTPFEMSEPVAEVRPEPRLEKPSEPRLEKRPEARPEPRIEARLEPRKPIMPPAPAAAPKPTPADAAADQSLADMAQRLEAALRKPTTETRTPARPAPASESVTEAVVPSPPRPTRPPEPKRPDAKPSQASTPSPGQGKTALYDSLEQEMANLLGRQNKT
jgi:flagellar protein FliO/FliZ